MSKLLLLMAAVLLISCASLEDDQKESSAPDYRFGRQMDERSMRSGFLER